MKDFTKEEKNLLVKVVVILLVVLGLLVNCTNNQMEEHKAKMIEKCGGEDKIVAYYTKEGDKFYTCKVEK